MKGKDQEFPAQWDQAIDPHKVYWSKVGLPQPYLRLSHCLIASEHL